MSNLPRWDPVCEMMTLREAMNRLFDNAFTHPISMSGVSAMLAIDLYQTNDEVMVNATLSELKADDVQISVTEDVLTLRGEFKQDNVQSETTYHIREKRFGPFERSIMPPTDVQTEKAKADFEKGILTITLPKADEVKPKPLRLNPNNNLLSTK